MIFVYIFLEKVDGAIKYNINSSYINGYQPTKDLDRHVTRNVVLYRVHIKEHIPLLDAEKIAIKMVASHFKRHHFFKKKFYEKFIEKTGENNGI